MEFGPIPNSDLGLFLALYSGGTPCSAQESGCSDRDPTGLAAYKASALTPPVLSLCPLCITLL